MRIMEGGLQEEGIRTILYILQDSLCEIFLSYLGSEIYSLLGKCAICIWVL